MSLTLKVRCFSIQTNHKLLYPLTIEVFSTHRLSEHVEITQAWAKIGVQIQWIWRLLPELPLIQLRDKLIQCNQTKLTQSRAGAVQIVLCEALTLNGQAVSEVMLNEFIHDTEWRNCILLKESHF